MSKPQKVTNRNAIPSDGNIRADASRADGSSLSVSGILDLQAVEERYEKTLEALRYLYATDLGWLRIAPQEHGETVYYKFKFTVGKWRNHYVMYRDDNNEPFAALVHLAGKVTDVLHGERRPSLDSYYENQ